MQVALLLFQSTIRADLVAAELLPHRSPILRSS